jgi:hypothetical protein
MNTFFRFSSSLICLALLAAHSLPHAFAADNEADDQGRLIAAPAETDLVERGYLFYPLRVLPKKQNEAPALPQPTVALAPVAQTSSKLKNTDADAVESIAVKSDDVHTDDRGVASQSPIAAKSVTAAAPSDASQTGKPAAASVLVQVVEPVKTAVPANASSAHGKQIDIAKDEHESSQEAEPEMSKAELAKAERAKAAEARAARLKEEQAKAELTKVERAKIAQARVEKIKQNQAKAERARAERVMLAAQAKVDKALDELAKAEKAFALLVNAETETADKDNAASAKDEQAKAATAKAEHGKDEQDKAAPGKAESAKAEPVKADHGGNANAPDMATTTAGQKILFLHRAEPAAATAEPAR